MTTTPECEGALSDLVLQAARTVVTSHPDWAYTGNPWKACSVKNQPLLTLLDCLIDAASAVATAINDNAWDDSSPVPAVIAFAFDEQARRIGSQLISASECPTGTYELPSFTEASALELA